MKKLNLEESYLSIYKENNQSAVPANNYPQERKTIEGWLAEWDEGSMDSLSFAEKVKELFDNAANPKNIAWED